MTDPSVAVNTPCWPVIAGNDHPDRGLGLRGLLALAAGIYFIFIGGSDVGVGSLSGQVANAVLATWLVVRLVRDIGHDRDAIDCWAIAAIGATVVSAWTSPLPRLSVEAAVASVAWAGAFYYLRRAVRHRPFRRAAIGTVGVAGLVLSLGLIALWGSVWMQWFSIGEYTYVPLDMKLPVGPFRHTHVAAMLVALTAPAIWHLGRTRHLRAVRWMGLLAVAGILFVSGGRGTWLASLVATAIAILASATVIRRPRRGLVEAVGLGVALLALAGWATGTMTSLADRVLTGETLLARLVIWESTATIFLEHPITGTGLGTFAPQLALAGYYDEAAFSPRHADSAYIQAAAEGGLVLLAALMGLVVAIARSGLRRARSEPIAVWALSFVAVAAITDNPTDSPNLVLLSIFWLALLVPRNGDDPSRSEPRQRGGWMGGVVLLLVGAAVASFHVATFTYELAKSAAEDNLADAVEMLHIAARLDPGFPLYRRDLGLARLAVGDTSGIDDLRATYELNPADDVTTRSLAWTTLLPDDERAVWARRSAAINSASTLNLVTAWLVTSEEAFLLNALWQYPWLPAAPSLNYTAMDRDAGNGQIGAAEGIDRPNRPQGSLARGWTSVLRGEDLSAADADMRALGALLGCEFDRAADRLEEVERPSSTAVIVARAVGLDSSSMVSHLLLLDRQQGVLAIEQQRGRLPDDGGSQDRVYYHRIPGRFSEVGMTLPTSYEALSAWMHHPREAAAAIGSHAYPGCLDGGSR